MSASSWQTIQSAVPSIIGVLCCLMFLLVLVMDDANAIQKAAAHFVAAVCSIRLKDVEDAESHLAAFDPLKSSLPPDHQVLAEEPFARQGMTPWR